jgi:hypothetical protein
MEGRVQLEGPSVLWASFFALLILAILIDSGIRWTRRRSLKPVRLSHATIALDLGPKLRRLLSAGSTFYITGGDGYPLAARFFVYPWWRRCLKLLLRKNCNIYYLLTNTNPDDEQRFLKLKGELEAGTKGTIQFCFATADRVDQSDKALVEKFSTFHPLLVEANDHRIMWIEGYHPAGSTVAYSCEFVPPPEAQSDPRFDDYKKMMTHLFDKYGTPLALARA